MKPIFLRHKSKGNYELHLQSIECERVAINVSVKSDKEPSSSKVIEAAMGVVLAKCYKRTNVEWLLILKGEPISVDLRKPEYLSI